MTATNYWNHFLNSGRVEDYMAFKAESSEKGEMRCMEETRDKTGDRPDAGVFIRNRNDNKDDTYR